MALSSKEREEMHKAIYEYMVQRKLQDVADQFAVAAELQPDQLKNGLKAGTSKLELKWIAIQRLKKQISDLEK